MHGYDPKRQGAMMRLYPWRRASYPVNARHRCIGYLPIRPLARRSIGGMAMYRKSGGRHDHFPIASFCSHRSDGTPMREHHAFSVWYEAD